jgi:hypothetical protein
LLKVHQRRGRSKELISKKLSVNKCLERQEGQQHMSDRPLLEIGQVADYRADFQGQWAAPRSDGSLGLRNKQLIITAC